MILGIANTIHTMRVGNFYSKAPSQVFQDDINL